MYVIYSEAPAIVVLVLATGLLGIYPAAINYVELAGRKPAHTFLDFSTAFVLTAIPCALALTGSGPHTDFTPGLWEQLSQDNGFLVWCACMAGLFMMVGSICLQFGMALTSMSICLPHLIAVSLSFGVGINYFMDTRVARASWIWPSLMCFSVAAIFGALTHVRRFKALKARRDKGRVVLEDLLHGKPLSAPLDSASAAKNGGGKGGREGVRVVNLPAEDDVERGVGALPSAGSSGGSSSEGLGTVQQRKGQTLQAALSTEAPDAVILDLESPHKIAARRLNSMGAQVMQDTNAFPQAYSLEAPKGHPSLQGQPSLRIQYSPRAITAEGCSPLTGLTVLGLGGAFFGLMSPFMFIATSALATTNYWRILPYGVPPLTAYNAFFCFALTFWFTAVGANLSLLYRPLFDCEESSVVEYLLDHRGRLASLGAGVAAGLGMALQFMGSLGGGYAVAELVKLYPLLSLALGLGLFKEFRGVGHGCSSMLAAMCVAYVLGVGLLAGARNHPLQQ